MKKLDEVKSMLKKYGQEHLLLFYDKMNDSQKEKLLNQIENIDFDLMKELYESTKKPLDLGDVTVEPIEHTDKSRLTVTERQVYEEKGIEAIKDHKLAVVTMAGGQGTRLGHSGPKGTYMLNTKNGPKYIFEIFIDSFKKAKNEYNVEIPWYIMTSKENHKETVEFLENHSYFGYNKDKIKFFMQGELPLLDTNGKVILNKEKQIKEAANGNGGIYESFAKSGLLNEIKQKQIEWVFVNNIDNIISNFVDPLLIGLTIQEKQKIGAKSVAKTNPKEKVGVFCKVNGKPQIIEYIDLPEEMTTIRDKNRRITIWRSKYWNIFI